MANDHTTNVLTAEIVRSKDPLLVSERVAAAAFLAGYSGGTRVSYTTDLRIFASWCHDRELNLLNAVLEENTFQFLRNMYRKNEPPESLSQVWR